MTLKFRFLVYTLLLAAGIAVLGFLAIHWYSGHFTALHRLAPSLVRAIALDKSPAFYYGLKQTPTDPAGFYYRDRVVVLMYHDVSQEPKDIASLSTANFEKQLALMQANNFKWITMSEYRDFILHGAPVPDNAVLLTFDDGYESLYTQAYPLLKQYGAPASSFLIVSKVGEKEAYNPKVTWEQIKEMQQNGITFFNHTFDSHRYMPTAPDNGNRKPMLARPIYLKKEQRMETFEEYEKRVTEDLRKATDRLRTELDAPTYALAFPYGAYSDTVLEISKQLGIDITFTVLSGSNVADDTNGYRLNAGGMDNDPDLQIELMKVAEKRLKPTHYPYLSDLSPTERRNGILIAAGFVLIVGLLWGWSGWRLLRQRAYRNRR